MDDKTLLKNTKAIIEMLLKNAGHSAGLDFAIINDTAIEINKRLFDLKKKN